MCIFDKGVCILILTRLYIGRVFLIKFILIKVTACSAGESMCNNDSQWSVNM